MVDPITRDELRAKLDRGETFTLVDTLGPGQEMGYTRVRHYAEGKQDWMKAGLPIEGSRAKSARRA